MRYIHSTQDSDFSDEKLREAYNADLANGLGNLVSRVAGLIEQNETKISPPSPLRLRRGKQDKNFNKLIDNFLFDQALKYIWDNISSLDGLITKTKPWALAKAGNLQSLVG